MGARFVSGSKTTTIGVEVPLVASETRCSWVQVQAKLGNTGAVYIGGSNLNGTTNGIVLEAPATDTTPDAIPISSLQNHDLIDLNQIYIDVEVDNEGVNFFYWI